MDDEGVMMGGQALNVLMGNTHAQNKQQQQHLKRRMGDHGDEDEWKEQTEKFEKMVKKSKTENPR
jgi:hypothetical protein